MVKEEVEETEKNVESEKVLPVALVEVPTQFTRAFQTPDGVLEQDNYLVWLGNKLIGIEQALVG